ncbi:MAG: hypothetical protein ACRCX5_12670 [Bacteroidales bacterium]
MNANIIRKLFVVPFQKGEDENIIRCYRKIDFIAQSGLLLFLICDPTINNSFKLFGLICFGIIIINMLTRYIHIISFVLNFLICSYWLKIAEITHDLNFQSVTILILCIILMLLPLLHFIYDFSHAKNTVANDSLVIMICLITDGFLYGLDDLAISVKFENKLDELILSLGEMICIFSMLLVTCTFLWGIRRMYYKYSKKTEDLQNEAVEVK